MATNTNNASAIENVLDWDVGFIYSHSLKWLIG